MKPARIVAASAALALLAGAGYGFNEHFRSRAAPPVAPPPASAAPSTPAGMLVDALHAGRLIALDESRSAAAGDWVKARPGFQKSRAPAARGGVEPCATQTFDRSAFGDWVNLSRGHFVAPRELALDSAGKFTLVIHLHGDEPILRELVQSKQRFVLYTLTLGPNQSYAPLFTGTHFYESIVAEVEQSLSKRTPSPARAGQVVLSAWSAGFVGIEAALAQPKSADVDAVVLVDGLHAPRSDRAAFEAQLKPFVEYGRRAMSGERFMFVSHSSIDPPDFASTTECAHYLLSTLGGRPQPVRQEEAMGLELIEYFSRGELHVRGYAGNDKADHCAQLATLRDVFAALGERWAAPKAP